MSALMTCARAAWLVALCTACSANGGEDAFGNGNGSGASGNGSGSSNGSGATGNGSGATGSGGGGSDIFGNAGAFNPSSNGSGPDGGCPRTTQQAEEIVTRSPVALFIMMDRSGSMVTGFPPPASPDSWNNSIAAVTAFVQDPASAGIDVGLGTFPFGPNNTADCGGADCGQPVVPIAPLPANAQAMIDAMNQQAPNSPVTLTPTECGLNGMINQCQTYMANSPTGEQCVAILVTDGTPTQCDTTQQNLINIAAQGAANGVLVFSLGLPGADMNFLNQVAQAGGTGASLDVTLGPQAFIDALNSIRDTVTTVTQLDCTWLLPNPTNGQVVDQSKVNVEFQANGISTMSFGKVPNAGECPNYTNGWYYDQAPGGQPSISACDDTCTMIKSSTGGRVDVILGCDTVPAILR